MPYIEHSFGRTFYISKGRKQKKLPLVVLHGGPGGTHKGLRHFLDLADERPVFLYDQVGGGKSSPLERKNMKISTFVSELGALLKAWKIPEFHLCGGSWGTTLALEYYLRKKGRDVQSLVFRSPMFSAEDWEKDAKRLIQTLSKKHQKVIRYCHEIGATDSKVYADAMRAYYLKFVLRNVEALNQMLKPGNPNGGRVYRHMWGPSEFKATGTLKSYDRVSKLKSITVPSLFVCGQYDEATPKTVESYHRKVVDSQFKVIKGASHVIGQEKPKELNKVVRSFLNSKF